MGKDQDGAHRSKLPQLVVEDCLRTIFKVGSGTKSILVRPLWWLRMKYKKTALLWQMNLNPILPLSWYFKLHMTTQAGHVLVHLSLVVVASQFSQPGNITSHTGRPILASKSRSRVPGKGSNQLTISMNGQCSRFVISISLFLSGQILEDRGPAFYFFSFSSKYLVH